MQQSGMAEGQNDVPPDDLDRFWLTLNRVEDDLKEIGRKAEIARSEAKDAMAQVTKHEAVCAMRYGQLVFGQRWMIAGMAILMLIEFGKAAWPEAAKLLLQFH